jgi:hypothetical protein
LEKQVSFCNRFLCHLFVFIDDIIQMFSFDLANQN